MLPGRSNRTRAVGSNANVTHPSDPVACSGAVVTSPNGIPSAKTSAPATECCSLSDTWKRATIVRRERSGCGENETPSISSRFGSETSPTDTVAPLGADAFATTAVGTDVAEDEPCVLRAVTRTRSVVAWSAVVSTYVLPFAPPIEAQLPPLPSHRRHWNANVIGCAPAHEPGFAVSVWFTAALPEIDGGDVFAGLPAAAADSTVPTVALDVAVALPSAFAAVTRTRRRAPTSNLPSRYVRSVAPGMAPQATPFTPPPLGSQRSQR